MILNNTSVLIVNSYIEAIEPSSTCRFLCKQLFCFDIWFHWLLNNIIIIIINLLVTSCVFKFSVFIGTCTFLNTCLKLYISQKCQASFSSIDKISVSEDN